MKVMSPNGIGLGADQRRSWFVRLAREGDGMHAGDVKINWGGYAELILPGFE
jgi:hypothetical protein